MPAVRHSMTSGPVTRNYLLGMNQYVPSTGYSNLGRWDHARSNDMYVVRNSVARTQPVENTIVCELSSDRHMVEPHGNYSSTFMQTPDAVGRKAKLMFTVQRPCIDPDFGSDYDKALNRLLGVQGDVAKTDDRRNFINGNQIRLNYNLFEPKTAEEMARAKAPGGPSTDHSHSDSASDPVKNDESSREDVDEDDEMDDDDMPPLKPDPLLDSLYQVKPELQEMWREVETGFNNRFMPVYGVNKSLIPYNLFPRFLKPGATVLVCFTLIHHAFMDESRTRYAYDSYTANVKELLILALADEGPTKSPSTPKRKGRYVSQTPPSRSTLKMAADTFVPVPTTSSSALAPHTPRPMKGKRREQTPMSGDASTATDTGSTASASQNAAPIDFASLLNTAISSSIPAGVSKEVSEDLIRALVPFIANVLQSSSAAAAGSTQTVSTPVTVEATHASSAEPGREPTVVSSPSTDSSTITQPTDNETESGSAEKNVPCPGASQSSGLSATNLASTPTPETTTKSPDSDVNPATKPVTPDRREHRRRK